MSNTTCCVICINIAEHSCHKLFLNLQDILVTDKMWFLDIICTFFLIMIYIILYTLKKINLLRMCQIVEMIDIS